MINFAELAGIEVEENEMVGDHAIVFMGPRTDESVPLSWTRKITIYNMITGKAAGNCMANEVQRIILHPKNMVVLRAYIDRSKTVEEPQS